MEVNPLQPEKSSPAIFLTSSPITISLRNVLPLNHAPISGQWKVTEVKPLQPSNADHPMLVTLFGISIEVKPLHPQNAASPMHVTLFGITIEVKTRQP